MATNKWIEIEGGIAWQDNNETVFKITGASFGLSSYFTVNESTKTVEVKSGAFSAATADSTKFSLAEEDGYTFTLATDIAQAASISAASLTFTDTGTTRTLTGALSAYYTSTPLEVTYHAAQSNVNLATIGGLSAGATLAMSSADNKTIMLDAPDLKDSAVTLSIVDTIAAATNYGFTLGLYEGGSASSSLGFGTGDNIWTVSSGTNNSAIYQNTTNEGWTLTNNGMSVSYTGVEHEDIVSISGFKGTLVLNPEGKTAGVYYKNGNDFVYAVSAAVGGSTFTVYHNALATNDNTVLTLTEGSGASAGWDYKLAFDTTEQQSSLGGGGSTLGLSAQDPYWTVTGGTATYQFNTTEGWTLDENAQSIAYSKAHSTGGAAGAFETPTTLASLSGLKNGASFTTGSVSISGTDTAKTITILTDNIFDISKDGNTAYFTDAPGDDVVYSLALSSGILQEKQVANNTKATLSAVDNETSYVKAQLDAYYSISGTSDATVTYHAKDTSANIATITGLAGTGAALTFFDSSKGASASVILLDSKDLGDKNVSLTQAGYSQAQTYSLSLATTTDSVLTTADHVDKTVTATLGLSSDETNYEVFGTTLKYYTLDGGLSNVTYNVPEQKVIATISGLSTNGVVLSGANANVSVDANDHRTIYLPEEALGTGTIELVNNKVGGTKAHGLKLQLVSASGASVSHIGIEDSGAHWKVTGQSATYRHYTTAGWSSTTGIKIEHKDATTPEAYFYIKGLSTSVQDTPSGEEPTDLDGVTINDKVVTIDTSILDKATSVNKEAKGEGYTFNLKAIDADENDGNKVGFGNEDGDEKYWTVTVVTNGGNTTYTLNYKYDIAEGWEINEKTGAITYTALNTKDLAQITGLTGLDKITDFTKHYTNEEVGIDVTTGVGYTFELSTSLLGTSAINLTKQAGASSTDTFKLAIADSRTLDDDTVYGFEDSGLYWSVSGTSATYQHDTAAGWTLKDNVVNYSASNADNGGKAKVTVTLTGLSNIHSESGIIHDITVTEKTFTHGSTSSKGGIISINDEDLFGLGLSTVSKSISLELGKGIYTGDYTLALGASLATQTVAKYDREVNMSLSSINDGKVSILGGLTDYFEVSGNSTVLTHHPKQENQLLATITGLSTTAGASNVKLESTTITLGKAALTNGSVSAVTVSISGVPEYTFDLDDDVLTTENVLDDTDDNLFAVTIKDGTATITGKTKAYYKDNDSNIAYYGASTVTLGTITGISTAAKTSDFSFTIDGNGGLSIGLSNAVLAKGSGITLTTVDSITGANGFKLYFTEDNGTTGKDEKGNDGAIGFVHGSLSWVHSGTQAIHRYDVGEGWTLADDGKSISYTGGKTGDNGTVLAKVTGLNGAYNNDALVTIASSGSAYTITLGESALAARDINLITTTVADDEHKTYSLALKDKSGNAVTSGHSIGLNIDTEGSWVIEDGIASYQADKTAGWTFASNNLITYTPTETGAQVLAQIEGLKSGLKVDSEGQIAGISVASNKIILSNSVLGTDKITLKDTPGDATTYILGLGGDVAQDDGSVTYWTTKGTTGTYKKDTQAYYSLSGTSGVDYHEATSKTLATLTNLPKGTTAASTGADRPATIDGIIVLPNSEGNGGTIKVGSDALSTDTKKFITLANGEGSTYSLKLDDDVATTLPSYVWSYGTTTKLLKATTPATYSDSDGKEIKYTAATMDNKTGTIFELGGVKKTVSEDDVIFYDDLLDSTTQAYWKAMVGSISLAGASTVADLTNAVIVKDTALDNKNVTLTTKQSGETKYKLLFFDTDLTDNISTSAPVVSDAGFTLSKTSAIYKGNITQGYTSSTDKKTGKVTAKYSAAKDGATLFTISGLPKDIKDSDLSGITVSPTTNSDGNYEVTVSAKILKRVTGKLTIKGTGYVFKLPDPENDGSFLTAADDRVTGGIDVWRVSGTTATYKKIKPAHYALDAKQTSISYVKEATFKSDKVDRIYAQIGGLPKGLEIKDDFTKNTTTNPTSKIGKTVNGTFTEYITVTDSETSKTYELATAAYENATKIEFTSKTGTNELRNTTLTALAAPSAITTGKGVWSVSGTTATLKTAGTSEGWEKKETTTKTTYTRKAAAASGSEILKISGLQKGLTVKADGTIEGIDNSGITIGTDGKVSGNVKVAASVYGTSNITFKLGKNMDGVTYTAEPVSAQTGQEIWTLSGTTLTIQKGTTASYTYDGKGTVTYKKANPTSTLVKITGLAKGKGLTLDQVQAGITVTGKTITFKDKTLLGTSDITATNSYKIELDSDISSNLMVEYTPTWSYSGEKATLKAASSGGFDATTTTKNGKTTLKYNKASAGNVLLTIDKLQKGLSVTAVAAGDNSGFANHIDGIDDSGLSFSTDKSTITGGTIKVSDVALNSKTVTLKNASTTLSKATLTYDGTNKSTTTNTIWEISGTTGKLYEAEDEGYRNASTPNNTVINYYNGKTKTSTSPLATVKGLKKSLKPDATGQIDGIDVSSTTITLDSRALGTTNVSVTGTGYTLALADTTTPATTYKCTVKGTTVTIREFTPASYEIPTSGANAGKIVYTGAKQGNIVATLSGVASGLKASADGSIEGINIEEASGKVTVTLGKAALGTTDVTVKAADGKTVNLAVDDGDSAAPTTTWQTTSDGNVILTTTYKQGYELATGAQSISYTDSGSVKTVISGFTGLTNSTSASTTPPSFITFDNDNPKVLKVDTSKVEINGVVAIAGGDYSLKLSSDPTTVWEMNGTTATLYKTLTANSFTCDGVKISKVKDARTQILATITGLPEGMTASDFDTKTKDADGNTIIKFNSSATTKLIDNATNIKLTGNGYKLAFSSYEDEVKPHETAKGEPVWSMKGTTATYAEGTTAGYTLSADGKTATYSAFALGKGKSAVATIKGLNSNYKPSDLTTNIGSAKTVTIKADMLGTTDLELSGTGYKFDTTSANLQSEVKWKAEDAGTTQGWTVKSGTATYQDITGAYYSAGATKITYNAAKASTSARATITGLNKNLKAVDGEIEGIEVGGDYITLSNSVLASGNVTITGKNSDTNNDYKLNLADDVPEPESTEPELSLNKTTVTLKNSTSAGYTVNENSKGVTFHKAANNVTLATVTGLKSGLTVNEDGSIDGVTFDGDNTITISDEALPTNTGATVKLTDDSKGGYKLALDSTESEEYVAAEDVWSFSSGTATFKNVKPKHYKLEGNTITYVGNTDLDGYATVTGITSFDEATNFGGDSTGGIITLNSNNLSTSKIASVQGSGFTFALGNDSLESKVDDDTIAWNNSTANNITTAKLTGKVTAGYLLENDSTKISYQNGNGSQTFAAIAGISSGQELETYIVDTTNKVVELDSDQLNKAVTVSSSFEFSVSFDSNYDNASIAGTAGAENVVIAGDGVSVSLGGGDDHVTFDGSNTEFYYGAGDGNDVITKFYTSNDEIHITKGSITSAEVKGEDIVLTVKDGSTTSTITLKDKDAVNLNVGDVLNYTNSKGNPASVKVKAASADLLYEDESNFVTAGSQFDEITPVTPAAQSLDEDLTSPQNFKLLTRQNSLLAYLNSKKK